MAALSTLERRIDRHMKESTEQIKILKTDLKTLKGVSKLKFQKASVEATKSERITKSIKPEVNRKIPPKCEKNLRKISVRMEEIFFSAILF